MRVSASLLSLLCAAGIASAAPMRIVVVSEAIQYKGVSSSGQEIKANILPVISNDNTRGMRRPCSMSKGKGFSISAAFRQALGLDSASKQEGNPTVFGSPVGVSFDPQTFEGHTKGGDRIKILAPPPHHPRPYHMHLHDEPVMVRIHRALMMLGPWEGRIVAFVLGCGLGVLLRIIYVAILLTYRAITHQSDNQEEEVEEEYLVPPPVFNYQFIDEKQPVLFEVAPEYDDHYEEVVEAPRQEDVKN